jgi:hypothetical protein
MRIRALANLVVGVLVIGIAALAGSADAKSPVVVELFTSQGCASCVSADDLIGDLADRPHVLALTFGVDYWDYLGWQDTFARTEFSERQRAYLKPLSLRDVYTPQVVIDGRLQAAANRPEDVNRLVKQAARDHANPPQIQAARGARIAIGYGHAPQGGAEVWLVRYDPHDQTVLVRAGDNRGKTIVEHNVVRQLLRLGAWKGRPKSFHAPASPADGLETAVIVQAMHGGRIVAAKKL